MIVIKGNAPELALEITGHAGYADVGRDIVCAGVSSLAMTLAAHMAQHADAGDIDMLCVDDGQLVLHMETASPRAEEYRALYRFCIGGLALLASQYPEYISIQTDLE